MLAVPIVSVVLLTGLSSSPAAATTDHSITVPGSGTGDPGSTVLPFSGAVITGTGNMAGVTIRIAGGFSSSVDLMGMQGSHPGITATYTASTGLLRLRGTASVADYQSALRDVTYGQSSPTTGNRTFIVVAGTAIYLPETGNLYQYVSGPAISWTAARAAALATTFGPFTGHLANLSSQTENDVALAELTGNTWIGASDQAVEDEWRWMDGPEAGQQFWQGTGTGSVVGGLYESWAAAEPNNSGGEDYAHMFGPGADAGTWNDFPDSNGVTGYLVEYEVDDIGQVAAQVRFLVGTDTDGDGVSDSDEATQSTDPNDPDSYLDTDGDGVPDSVELADGTDPNDGNDALDTDGDGLSDYEESRGGTNPLSRDTDGDEVPDGVEVAAGTDGTDPDDFTDTDGDGVPDHVEAAESTDPADGDEALDTDGDGVPDYVERADGTDPNDGNDSLDTDSDGLSDYEERRGGTDPNLSDSDGDGIDDDDELTAGSDPNEGGSYPDSDRDGVPDAVESTDGSDPNDPRSFPDDDGDGVSNYADVHGMRARPNRCDYLYQGNFTDSTSNELVAKLYLTYFRRVPDAAGYAYWIAQADQGMTIEEMALLFARSSEFDGMYGSGDEETFTSTVYRNFLCRTVDSAGSSYWVALLRSGALDRGSLMRWFVAGNEYRIGTGYR